MMSSRNTTARNEPTARSRVIVLVSTVALMGGLTAYRGQAVALPPAQDAPAATSTSDGVYTEDQATRGQKTFMETCAVCHKEDLSGTDAAPALTGAEFLGRWENQSVGDLFERTRMTMPLDNPGSLSAQTALDLIAFVLKANAFPAGKEELKNNAVKNVMIKRK